MSKVYFATSRDGLRPDHQMFSTEQLAIDQAVGMLRHGMGGGRKSLCIVRVSVEELATVELEFKPVITRADQE